MEVYSAEKIVSSASPSVEHLTVNGAKKASFQGRF